MAYTYRDALYYEYIARSTYVLVPFSYVSTGLFELRTYLYMRVDERLTDRLTVLMSSSPVAIENLFSLSYSGLPAICDIASVVHGDCCSLLVLNTMGIYLFVCLYLGQASHTG